MSKKLFVWFVEWFVRWWAVKSVSLYDAYDVRKKMDLTVAVTYTSLPSKLVDATLANLKGAIEFKLAFPETQIAFCCCESDGYPSTGAGEAEYSFKTAILGVYGITPIVGRHIGNTIDEVMCLKEVFDNRNFRPARITICTGQLHSPSALLVWQMLFPSAEILVSTISYKYEIQPDHPVADQRTLARWIWSNIKRQAALRVCWMVWKVHRKSGLRLLGLLRKIKHKPART